MLGDMLRNVLDWPKPLLLKLLPGKVLWKLCRSGFHLNKHTTVDGRVWARCLSCNQFLLISEKYEP